RLGLPHVTLDRTPWSAVEKLLARVVEERVFVQIVVHTARCVRGFGGARLAGRLARLIARCVHLDALGQLRWVSVLSGVVAGTGEGRNLIHIAGASEFPDGSTVCETLEPIIPGVPYRLEWKASNGASRTSVEMRDRRSDEIVRVVARRRGLILRATFGVDRAGEW